MRIPVFVRSYECMSYANGLVSVRLEMQFDDRAYSISSGGLLGRALFLTDEAEVPAPPPATEVPAHRVIGERRIEEE